jgi:hypothetical protein
MPYPCCCYRTVDCDEVFLLDVSGAADGSCSLCDPELNATFTLGQLFPFGVGTATVCGVTIDHLAVCRWQYDFGHDGVCLDPGDWDLEIYYEATQYHVWVRLGTPVTAFWFKTFSGTVARWPISLGPADYQTAGSCNSSETVCDMSAATLYLYQ